MIEKIRAWVKSWRNNKREQRAVKALIKAIEQALGIELYSWQRLYIFSGIWQPPEGGQQGRTLAYILRLLLDQSKPLLLYEQTNVRAYADNPFSDRQHSPVPVHYMIWFGNEVKKIYKQLAAAGVPVREVLFSKEQI